MTVTGTAYAPRGRLTLMVPYGCRLAFTTKPVRSARFGATSRSRYALA